MHIGKVSFVLASVVIWTTAIHPEVAAPEEVTSPRLYRVILPVTDMEQAAAFYAAVFELPGEPVSPGRHYFNLGGTILAVYDPSADGDEPADGWRHHPNQYLYFGVDDLEASVERARSAGALELTDIQSMPWGERLAYAKDPSGNPICFVDDQTLFTGGSP